MLYSKLLSLNLRTDTLPSDEGGASRRPASCGGHVTMGSLPPIRALILNADYQEHMAHSSLLDSFDMSFQRRRHAPALHAQQPPLRRPLRHRRSRERLAETKAALTREEKANEQIRKEYETAIARG